MNRMNILHMKKYCVHALATALLLIAYSGISAQEKTATITLAFNSTDSTKTCVAHVTSDSGAVAGTEIHLYVQRMYSLLAVGKVIATDENGDAAIDFPVDLPGDQNKNITVIAKIEGDDNYGNAETTATVKWGAEPKEKDLWNKRSLSASREKAPMLLVVASNLIIIVIWGTILYLITQLFRIKKSGKPVTKTAKA